MDPRVSRVIEILEKETCPPPQISLHNACLPKQQSIESLAYAVNLSESRLRVLFKTQTGMTPEQYRRHLRMERVKEMVETSFLTINDILMLLQVGDPSHFMRMFKEVYGVSLGEFRKRVQSNGKIAESANE